jgi:hypothetical protein
MSNELPKGYRVLNHRQDSIVIGMFDFMLIHEDAKAEITYAGKKYKRGSAEVVPKGLANHCCSCREYIEIKEESNNEE